MCCQCQRKQLRRRPARLIESKLLQVCRQHCLQRVQQEGLRHDPRPLDCCFRPARRKCSPSVSFSCSCLSAVTFSCHAGSSWTPDVSAHSLEGPPTYHAAIPDWQVGAVWSLCLWAPGIRKTPILSKADIKSLAPIGLFAAAAHGGSVLAMGAGAVSFAQVF